jgi:type VI secretion system VasD/TssJ family lipoprotein
MFSFLASTKEDAMMSLKRTFFCLGTAFLLFACSSAPRVKQPPDWAYEQAAIQLHLSSDPQLNLFQKQPHSLIVCLYHLRDPNSFNQLVDEKGGLPKLLDCSHFDPSVTYSKRLVIQPNQELNEFLSRSEGAKFVGIVAGYYSLQKESSVRWYPVPVTETAEGSLLVQKPAKLSIHLILGPHEIRQPAETAKAR